MSYTMNGEQYCQSTKTDSRELATKVWKKRESEIVLGLFKVGWAGEPMRFEQLVAEFEHSHSLASPRTPCEVIAAISSI
jgi:hypothetical protein